MKPVIVRSIAEMQKISRQQIGKIGFVPTMGYLHDGHLSLVKEAKKRSDIVVVSIYVNPAQFGPSEDLSNYPRDLNRDVDLLADLRVNYIFFPSNEEMYPDNYKTWVSVEDLTDVLCGKSRPNHFRGVTTIVTKLMNIVNPDFMFMGEKDFQQLAVLKQMGNDLNFPTEIIGCPLIREEDGLAMSSRNKYLSEEQHKQALALNKSLILAQKLFSSGIDNSEIIIERMRKLIEHTDGKIDYIEFVDPDSLQSIDKLFKGCRVLLAVYIGKTRLIDNIEITD